MVLTDQRRGTTQTPWTDKQPGHLSIVNLRSPLLVTRSRFTASQAPLDEQDTGRQFAHSEKPAAL